MVNDNSYGNLIENMSFIVDFMGEVYYTVINRPTKPLPQGTRNLVGIFYWGQYGS